MSCEYNVTWKGIDLRVIYSNYEDDIAISSIVAMIDGEEGAVKDDLQYSLNLNACFEIEELVRVAK